MIRGTLVKLVMVLLVSLVSAVANAMVTSSQFPWPGGMRATTAETPAESGLTLRDVGGHDEIKDELHRCVIAPLRYPHLFYGGPRAVQPPRGVLLHGPPGTGKTMLATATASEAGVPMIRVHAAAIESKWYGETPNRLRRIFEEARRRPSIIFFDELDGIGRTRSEAEQSCTYTLKCELLRQMDALGDAPVVVLACTNCPRSLDPALRRRFARSLDVRPPRTADERLSVLRALVRNDETGGDADGSVLSSVAERSHGRTGSDLASLYQSTSARRMRNVSERVLDKVRDGHELLQRLGPLSLHDWEETAKNTGWPLAPSPKPPLHPPQASQESDTESTTPPPPKTARSA